MFTKSSIVTLALALFTCSLAVGARTVNFARISAYCDNPPTAPAGIGQLNVGIILKNLSATLSQTVTGSAVLAYTGGSNTTPISVTLAAGASARVSFANTTPGTGCNQALTVIGYLTVAEPRGSVIASGSINGAIAYNNLVAPNVVVFDINNARPF